MAKLTKSMLKGIVKECLVEILSEGLGSEETLSEVSRPLRRAKKTKSRKSIFDQMDKAFDREPRVVDNTRFENSISIATKTATDDPLLQSILEDQMMHESKMPTTAMAGSMPSASASSPIGRSSDNAGIDITSLFGDVVENWGELLDRSAKK
jgi:hypothetical protein